MKLENFLVYQLAMELGEKVWNLVNKWNYFSKETIGKQLIRSIDSVSANLSEGFGRYHYRENKNFSYYSRGSLYESKTWLKKAHNRRLIKDEDYNELMKDINNIAVKLNNYISSIGKNDV